MSISHSPSRRAFLAGLTAVTGLPVLSEAFGATLVPQMTHQPSPISDSPEMKAQMEIVKLRYGNYLESSDMPLIQRGLERIHRSAAEILKVDIRNGDAPDCLFRPDGL